MLCSRDVSIDGFPHEAVRAADLVAFYVPMHTATRLAVPLVGKVRALNADAHLCFYGLYAPVNESYLHGLGAQTVLGGEFETGLLRLCNRLRTKPGELALPVRTHRPFWADSGFFRPTERVCRKLSRLRAALDGRRTGKRPWAIRRRAGGCKHRCRHCPVVPVYNGRFRIVQADVVLDDIAKQVDEGATHNHVWRPRLFQRHRTRGTA